MAYLGMNARTGLRIADREHLTQSIGKVLSTSIGTRLRRRPFGSLAPDLVDAPANSSTLVQLYAAAATALMSWEPRLNLRRISAQLALDAPGGVALTIEGETVGEDGTQTAVSVTTSLGA